MASIEQKIVENREAREDAQLRVQMRNERANELLRAADEVAPMSSFYAAWLRARANAVMQDAA